MKIKEYMHILIFYNAAAHFLNTDIPYFDWNMSCAYYGVAEIMM